MKRNFDLKLQYRLIRYLFSRYERFIRFLIAARYRLITRIRFRYLRLLVFFMWRLWVGKVEGFEKIPQNGAAIIVSNHLSYFDFFIMASIIRKHAVFIAVKNLDQRSFVGWFMKLDYIVYVDRDKPGYKFFKDVMWHLKQQGRLVVIYPEGTRSRSGKMLTPKPGFIKLAMKTGAPIVPIVFKGTYEILPPHKHLPKLKKCDITVLDKMYISPSNPEFCDIFFRRQGEDRKYGDLNDEELQEIAFRIMNKIRVASGQEWEEGVNRPELFVPEEVKRRREQLLSQANE